MRGCRFARFPPIFEWRLGYFNLVRLLVAIVGIAALVGTNGPVSVHEPARPLVVLVHGRGQNGQDSAARHREWKRDLDSSLALVGMPSLPDDDVRLVWYADVLDPESDGGCGVRSAGDSLSFGDVARGLVGLLANVAPSDESRDVRGVMGDLLYLLDPSTRCAAERRVGNAIAAAARENRPVIIVAYSLGSLVTHGYLSARDTTKPLALRLITLGSPLGIRVIREIVFGPSGDTLRLPTGVSAWDNVYDPGDVFSAPLGGGVSERAIHDLATSGTAEDPHTFAHYLRDRRTGEALQRALCAFTPGCAQQGGR